MVFWSLELHKAERKPSLLSSIKKHFKHLNDTSFHYSPEPTTSSKELSSCPQSHSQYWLSDWLMMSSQTHTHQTYVHTHKHPGTQKIAQIVKNTKWSMPLSVFQSLLLLDANNVYIIVYIFKVTYLNYASILLVPFVCGASIKLIVSLM